MNTNITLKVSKLCKNYDDIKAVKDASFVAHTGDIIALLGPNGAGKSTLMNIIAGYLSPTSGNVEVLGRDIVQYPIFAKDNIGFLPEGSPLYDDLSVSRFLSYMSQIRGLNKDAVLKAIRIANISDVMKQKIETLSKGYKRRVGFAQSILSNPPILLLDEPTDGLDPNQKDYMRSLIKNLAKDKTIIISTHLLEEVESVCNRIILLDNGIIKADSNLKTLLQNTNCRNIADAFRLLTGREE